jgi:hypothetical protein
MTDQAGGSGHSAVRRAGRNVFAIRRYTRESVMRCIVLSLLASSLALSACGADTDAEVTNKMSKKDRKTLPQPTQILVYDLP